MPPARCTRSSVQLARTDFPRSGAGAFCACVTAGPKQSESKKRGTASLIFGNPRENRNIEVSLLFSLGSRKPLSPPLGFRAGNQLGPQPPARFVMPVEILRRPPIREPD